MNSDFSAEYYKRSMINRDIICVVLDVIFWSAEICYQAGSRRRLFPVCRCIAAFPLLRSQAGLLQPLLSFRIMVTIHDPSSLYDEIPNKHPSYAIIEK